MKKTLIFLLAALLLSVLPAQNNGLTFSPAGVSVLVNRVPIGGDTAIVAGGNVLTFEARIVNTSNFFFSDEFGFAIARTDSGIVGLDTLFPAQSMIDSLAPNDSIALSVDDTVLFSTDRYSGGGGVVTITIWPAAKVSNPGLPPGDSANVSVLILTTSIDPGWKDRGLAVLAFPNPAQTLLYIHYGEIKKEVEYVRIFNSQGQVLHAYPVARETLDLTDLPAGHYFLHLEGRKGEKAVLKVLKQ